MKTISPTHPDGPDRRSFLRDAGRMLGGAAASFALLPPGRAAAATADAAPRLHVPRPTLAEIGKARGIAVGGLMPDMPPAVLMTPVRDAVARIGLREFDAAVVICKNDEIMRADGSIDWSRPQAVIDYLRPHQVPVIWHTLFWSLASPYVRNITDRRQGVATLKRWIQDFLSHWGDYPVHSVQVVNELLDPWSTQRWGYNVHGLNGGPHPWISTIGEDAPELALRYAAEVVPPGTKLVLNERPLAIFGGNWGAYNRQRYLILATLRRWLDNKVPIDALGIQLHIAPAFQPVGSPHRLTRMDYIDIDTALAFMDEVAALGLEIHLTEFDCTDLYLAGLSREERRAKCAGYARRVLAPLLAHKAVRLFETWGISDSPVSSYLADPRWDQPDPRWGARPTAPRPREAMLYDAATNPHPKPVRHAVATALAAAAPR
jgi:endo-1,4-beta-xylanase